MSTLRTEVRVARLICATSGCVPILISAWKACWGILFVTSVSASFGVFSASTANTNTDDLTEKERIIGAMNAGAAVLFALGCTMSIDIHKTLVGSIRVLWLVTLVTSSSGYAYIRALFPEMTFIPNDVALAATTMSVVLLLASIVVARCSARSEVVRDKRTMLVEVALAAGALTLRFDEEMYEIFSVHLGWALWHLSCWLSALVAVQVLSRRQAEPPRDHAPEVTMDLEEMQMANMQRV